VYCFHWHRGTTTSLSSFYGMQNINHEDPGLSKYSFSLVKLSVVRMTQRWWQINEMWIWSNGRMILTLGKPKYFDSNLSQCHFAHHKCSVDCCGTELVPHVQADVRSTDILLFGSRTRYVPKTMSYKIGRLQTYNNTWPSKKRWLRGAMIPESHTQCTM
jgi:hypothetical protein